MGKKQKKEPKVGYLYLMSNPAFRYIKLGRCDDWPSTRAKTLSRICSSPFDFKVERAWKTDNNCAAEYEGKQLLRKYWVAREFYDVSVDVAAGILEKALWDMEPFNEEEARMDMLRRSSEMCRGYFGNVEL